jgi:hypothetical protein
MNLEIACGLMLSQGKLWDSHKAIIFRYKYHPPHVTIANIISGLSHRFR